MPYDVHQEKKFSQPQEAVFSAVMNAIETLKGKIVSSKPTEFKAEVKFDKTVLGKVLGDRTQMTCVVQSQEDGSNLVMDIYPLDAVERKLMFGARKGVSEEVLRLFVENIEANLGK